MELKSIYDAAPEMYELLNDISYPRRGSEAETWVVPGRLVQLAIRIVAEIDPEKPSELDRMQAQNAELVEVLKKSHRLLLNAQTSMARQTIGTTLAILERQKESLASQDAGQH